MSTPAAPPRNPPPPGVPVRPVDRPRGQQPCWAFEGGDQASAGLRWETGRGERCCSISTCALIGYTAASSLLVSCHRNRPRSSLVARVGGAWPIRGKRDIQKSSSDAGALWLVCFLCPRPSRYRPRVITLPWKTPYRLLPLVCNGALFCCHPLRSGGLNGRTTRRDSNCGMCAVLCCALVLCVA